MQSDTAALGPLTAFLEATVRVATPLALAAVGETVTQRSGVINIGLEGAMLIGALAGAVGALAAGTPWAGLVAAAAAGIVVGFLFATVTVRLRGDQIVVGTAFTLGAIGLTGAWYRAAFGVTGAAMSVPSFAPLRIPLLSSVPVIGPALFAQPAPTYLLYALLPVVWFVMTRSQPGLALRACGESPEAAASAGINVRLARTVATMFGSMLGGVAGASLVLAQAGTFAERMTAGRGFIAIAIVVLGRWHPMGAAAAALLFGAASAMQFGFQAAGVQVPYQIVLMLPYAVTLLALAGVGGRARSPAALGQA